MFTTALRGIVWNWKHPNVHQSMGMDTQTAVGPTSGMLISNKKEWVLVAGNLGECQNNYAASKKRDNKRMHTIWFHLHRNLRKYKPIYGDRKQISRCLGKGWVGLGVRRTTRGTGRLGVINTFTLLIVVMVSPMCIPMSKRVRLYTLNTDRLSNINAIWRAVLKYQGLHLTKEKKEYSIKLNEHNSVANTLTSAQRMNKF